MDALPAVADKAFLDADNAHVEVFLVADLLVLHQGHAQAAARNIHHQHALPLTGDFGILQCLADGHEFCINFLGHVHDLDLKAGFAINLVQEEDLVAGLAHGGGSLQLVFLHTVLHHEALEALQNLTDF